MQISDRRYLVLIHIHQVSRIFITTTIPKIQFSLHKFGFSWESPGYGFIYSEILIRTFLALNCTYYIEEVE